MLNVIRCVYAASSVRNVILMFLLVDDILLTESCTSEINKFKTVLMNVVGMNDLENMVFFLGMKILRFEKRIIVYQLKYELELLKRFSLMNCKSIITPEETNHKLYFDLDGEKVDQPSNNDNGISVVDFNLEYKLKDGVEM